MKKTQYETNSEKYFAEYLRNRELEFDYEPPELVYAGEKIHFNRPPDFVIQTGCGPVICEVKELGKRPDQQEAERAAKGVCDRIENLSLPWTILGYCNPVCLPTQKEMKLFCNLIKTIHNTRNIREGLLTEFAIPKNPKHNLSLASEIALYAQTIQWRQLNAFDMNDKKLQKELSQKVAQSLPIAVVYAIPDSDDKFPYAQILNNKVMGPMHSVAWAAHICSVSRGGGTGFSPGLSIFGCELLLGGEIIWEVKRGVAGPCTMYRPRIPERLRNAIGDAKSKFKPVRNRRIPCVIVIGSPQVYPTGAVPEYQNSLIEVIKDYGILRRNKNTTVSAICLLSLKDSGEPLLCVYRNPYAKKELPKGIFRGEIDKSYLLTTKRSAL